MADLEGEREQPPPCQKTIKEKREKERTIDRKREERRKTRNEEGRNYEIEGRDAGVGAWYRSTCIMRIRDRVKKRVIYSLAHD